MINRQKWAPCWFLAASVACAFGFSGESWAQDAQTPAPASSSSGPAQPGQPTDNSKGPATPDPYKPQNDRIFYALPNFLTVENASDVPPLTVGQKFKLVARSTFDPVEYPFVGVEAAINQASNSEPAFGQGVRGYAKRYGTAFADTVIGNFMTNAVVPSLLHQDPRYFQMGKGRFVRRASYALTRVFITRADSGKTQFNFSELLGNAMAAGISNAYHPPPRTFLNDVSIWWTQIGWDAAGFELKEFWPDLKHKLHRSSGSRPVPD